jgi:uncharacterized protein YdeI (YjbR/CyaY-like superfamily)
LAEVRQERCDRIHDQQVAIDCALAHGWVDGQLGRVDEHFFKTRFTPRRPRSVWSQVNRERVDRLEVTGCLRSAGRAQVEHGKADGRWAAAYARQSDIAPDADFISALNAEPAARELFFQLDASNRFAVLFRIHQAGRRRNGPKIAEMITMLGRGETIHRASRSEEWSPPLVSPCDI